jgi:2-dehydropantoate 2-reductase
MKHAILGAGAVGGLMGTALASLGEDVTVVVRPENLAGYPACLTLERPQGSLSAPAKAVAALTTPVDVLWIATKTYQLQKALEAVHSLPACAVPMLNGVDHLEILHARFGRDRVVPATIVVEAEKIAPGRFLQRTTFVRLTLAAGGEPLLGGLIGQLSDRGFTGQFVQDERVLLWNKLCFLAPLALVTSASGLNKGEILDNPGWRRKLVSAIDEACAVARAGGAEIHQPRLKAIFDSLPPTLRTSMQKDFAAGRPLEVDAITAPIIRGGERYGIDVSTTVELVAAIRAKIAAHQALSLIEV